VKKFIAIILMCLFTANICGASISYHFCGKLFQYYAFNGHKKKSKCCCKGSQKKKGCCKTEHHKVKVDDNKSFAKQLVFEKQIIAEAIVPQAYPLIQQSIQLINVDYTVPLGHSPPTVRTVPIHILHQQFLI
jgi:hypothetical protein